MSPFLAQVASSLFIAPALAGAGAVLVAVPIAIHLLSRFRRRRQEWGAMRFVFEAFQKQRRRLQMEQLVLLLVRCLLVLTLGLALAGPILPGCSEQLRALGLVETSGRTVHLVLDDSLATRAVDPASGRARFEAVRELAERVRGEADAESIRYWTTGRGPGSSGLEAEGAEGGLPEAATFSRGDLSGTLGRVAEAIAASGSPQRRDLVVVIGPLARGSAEVGGAEPPEAWGAVRERVRLLVNPPMPGLGNVQVVRAEPRRGVVVAGSGGRAVVPVDVSVRRFDAVDTGVNARLRVAVVDREGRVLGEATRGLAFPAGDSEQSASVDVAVEVGLGAGGAGPGSAGPIGAAVRATVEGLEPVIDALVEDTARWSAVELRAGLRVGVVDEAAAGADGGAALRPARWAALALAPRGRGSVEVETIAPAAVRSESSVLEGLDAVVLLRPDLMSEAAWTRLAGFAEAGGLVWVTAPATETSASGWTRAMRDAFGAAWRLGVEAEAIGGEAGVMPLADRPPPAALELLASDWEALMRPVRVWRWVPVSALAEASWVALPGGGDAAGGQVPSLLAYHAHGRGGLLFLAAALDPAWTSLPTKPVFVPLVHEAVRGTLGTSRGVERVTGGAQEPGLRRLLPAGEASERGAPGVYERGGELVVANVDPAAGDTRAIDAASVERYFDALGPWSYLDPQALGPSLRGEGERGPNIGWAILWIVLALVVMETVLARVFSHAKDAGNRGLTLAVMDRMRRFYRVHHAEQERKAA